VNLDIQTLKYINCIIQCNCVPYLNKGLYIVQLNLPYVILLIIRYIKLQILKILAYTMKCNVLYVYFPDFYVSDYKLYTIYNFEKY
jgi:hypothetical protein